jgi:hypothetical protein
MHGSVSVLAKRARRFAGRLLRRASDWLVQRDESLPVAISQPAPEEDDPTEVFEVELSPEAEHLLEEGRIQPRSRPVNAPEGPPVGSTADRVKRSRGARW